MNKQFVSILLFIVCWTVVRVDAATPNVLIITVDNLGYGDMSSYNAASTIRTPNLDRFAKQGARLTDFYTASSTCTVSRACLLTGRIAQRHRLLDQLAGVKGNYGVGLRQSEILIPAILKKAPTPYATGCFGKWNIGFAKGSRPTERGFDEFVGHASGNIDYYRHNYRERHDLYQQTKELHRKGVYSTDLFADAAIEFITRQSKADPDSKQPWFCYLPFNSPHFPSKGNRIQGELNIYQAPDWAFTEIGLKPDETDARKRYAATVYALDKAIGRVLDALDKTGNADNTFVFFLSDNGAFALNRKGIDVGDNTPLRSGGITCWEGGIRVAAMARWPGKIEAGTVIAEPCWAPDLLVTTAKLAGAKLPADVVYDGRDIMPVLSEGEKSPHASLYFSYRSHAALRMGDWKIVREKPTQTWMLFNLQDDVSEKNNLAKKKPEMLAKLKETFELWGKSFK